MTPAVPPKHLTRNTVFGPVPSRRLGLSLGVDLTYPKTCTLDCVYCQLGRTTCLIPRPRKLVPAQTIARDLQAAARELRAGEVDYVTLSGSGEPTLNADIQAVIGQAKQVFSCPIAVLTNSTLLATPGVRQALLEADLVVPSLDAADKETFQRVNRPHPAIEFSAMIEGLRQFSREYAGKIWIEVMLVKGVNDSPAHIDKLQKLLQTITYDRVQLNTPQRPPAELTACPLDKKTMQRLTNMLGPRCEVISEFSHHRAGTREQTERLLLDTLQRRPLTLEDIAASLGLHPNEVVKLTAVLRQKGLISVVYHHGRRYFTRCQAER